MLVYVHYQNHLNSSRFSLSRMSGISTIPTRGDRGNFVSNGILRTIMAFCGKRYIPTKSNAPFSPAIRNIGSKTAFQVKNMLSLEVCNISFMFCYSPQKKPYRIYFELAIQILDGKPIKK